MAQINARDWIFEVSEDPGAATPVWAQVAGLTSFDLNNAEGEESADTTTFDSQGYAESQAMQRGASLALEGQKLPGDPGQAAVESLADEVGEASLGGVRFRHVTDTDWTVWTAWASLGSKGGGNNDKTSWAATLTRSGRASVEAV
jgi:hypothetical protein